MATLRLEAVRLTLALALLVAGCNSGYADRPVDTDNPDTAFPQRNIVVWHDDERAVTCWVFYDGARGGISCLPDSEVGR